MKILCINLQERRDRLDHFKKEFYKTKFGSEFILIEAIKHSIGYVGCKMTYLSIFEQFKNEDMLIIFEDDVLFLDNFNENFLKSFNQLPKNWDMLYLGGNPQQPQKRYSDNLFLGNNIFTTHAIVYNNQRGIFQHILNSGKQINKIDVFFANEIQRDFCCFLAYPMIATQYDNPSDICKNSDYSMIEKNYKKFCQ